MTDRGFVYGQQPLGNAPHPHTTGQPPERVYTAHNPSFINQEAIPGPMLVHDVVAGQVPNTVGQLHVKHMPSAQPSMIPPTGPAATAPALGPMSSFGGGGAAPAPQAPPAPAPAPAAPMPAQAPAPAPAPMAMPGMTGTPLAQLDGVLAQAVNMLANSQAGSDPTLMGQLQLVGQILQANGYNRTFGAIDLWSKTRGVQVAGRRRPFRTIGLMGIENRTFSSWGGPYAPPGYFDKTKHYPPQTGF